MKILIQVAKTAAALTLGVSATPTQASPGCAKEYSRFRDPHNYSRAGWGNSFTTVSWHPFSADTGDNNVANSVWAHGGQCTTAYSYKDAKQSGHDFYLHSQARGWESYTDPALRHDAGSGPYRTENFEDALSSYTFTDC